MTKKHFKNGPIHFIPTAERDPVLHTIVEYCVQKGEKQYINASQAAYLISTGQVYVDGIKKTTVYKIGLGVKSVKIRDRVHIVIIHPAITE